MEIVRRLPAELRGKIFYSCGIPSPRYTSQDASSRVGSAMRSCSSDILSDWSSYISIIASPKWRRYSNSLPRASCYWDTWRRGKMSWSSCRRGWRDDCARRLGCSSAYMTADYRSVICIYMYKVWISRPRYAVGAKTKHPRPNSIKEAAQTDYRDIAETACANIGSEMWRRIRTKMHYMYYRTDQI